MRLLILFSLFPLVCFAQFPSNFTDESIGTWDIPIAIGFDQSNQMYVAERDGRFFKYSNNTKTLLLDISEEVGFYGDYGLLSMTLDPNFETNGRVYFFYVVDRYFLFNSESPNYNPGISETGATIARVTSYELDPSDNFDSVVENSRNIILGSAHNNGIPLVGIWHAGGDLAFSSDGSLLVATGDGTLGADYVNQAYSNGILSTEEYNTPDAWRCQILNSLNGKILRIDPSNGNGVPGNPYYDVGNPSSIASKIWAKGFRNPFRIKFIPNTGSHYAQDGQPGTLLVGEVGQNTFEEINLVDSAGQNYGWPRLEGISQIAASNSNHNPALSSLTPPLLQWGRSGTPKFSFGSNSYPITESPFNSAPFIGGCAIGGDFYLGDSFPEEYRDGYFFADYNNSWIKYMKLNAQNEPVSVQSFNNSISGIIYLKYNPNEECLYYCSINGKIGKVTYNETADKKPIAVISSTATFGPSPLTVNFNGSQSTDDIGISSFEWFIDNISVSFSEIFDQIFTSENLGMDKKVVKLMVTDSQGQTGIDSVVISINNTPPKIISTSLDSINTFDPSGQTLNLMAYVIDQEEDSLNLNYMWNVELHHNTHFHPEPPIHSKNVTMNLGEVPCDDHLYFYRFTLTVEDNFGLYSVFQKDLFPNCNISDTLNPVIPYFGVGNFGYNEFTLEWGEIQDNEQLKNVEVMINDESVGFLDKGSQKFTYTSEDASFTTYIIARDHAGNAAFSSTLHFEMPESRCMVEKKINYLSDHSPLAGWQNGYGPFEKDQSNGGLQINDGQPLKLNTQKFEKGIGVHAYSKLEYDLNPLDYGTLSFYIGLDDYIQNDHCGLLAFKVSLNDTLAFQSGTFMASTPHEFVTLDVRNKSKLKLEVLDGGNGNGCDFGDWADIKLSETCPFKDKLIPSFTSIPEITNRIDSLYLSWDPGLDNEDEELSYQIYLDDSLIIGTNTLHSSIPKSIGPGLHKVCIQSMDDFGNITVSETKAFEICPEEVSVYSNFIDAIEGIEAQNYIQINSTINSLSEVYLQAGKEISLHPGFQTELNSLFQAEIKECGSY